ncbi:MAG: GNAT family N-acetyltransferase [Candidatus Lokiarchaeota archaeon]
MQINFKKFDENVDINEISSFLFKVQKTSGYLDKDTSVISLKKELEELRNKYKFVLFEAYESNRLIGLLLLFTNTPKFGIIWDWHPVVLPNGNKDDIAIKLIKECIAFAKQNDITRIEVCFTLQKDKEIQRYREHFKLFKSLDFYHVIEEAEMELNLNGRSFKRITIPQNFETKSIKEFEINELYNTAYESMNNSKDNMFLDLTEEQKWSVIKNYFQPSKQIIQDASFILTEGNKPIGYSIAKHSTFEPKKATIGAFGILPNFRNKGLGEALLLCSLKKLIENNFEVVNLDVALENKPAYKLYLKVGFKKTSSTNILALNC